MKNNRKKILLITFFSVLLAIVAAGVVGFKMYTMPHRNVEIAKAVKVSAFDLVSAYENNEVEANTKYLDKILEVKGEVASVSKNQKGEQVVTLKGTDLSGLICTLETSSPADVKPNMPVSVRGICTGFLTDVVLVRSLVQADD